MLIVLSPSCSMDMSHFHIPCELNSSMTMYVGEGREGSQGGALSMWTHASVHVDCLLPHYEQVHTSYGTVRNIQWTSVIQCGHMSHT